MFEMKITKGSGNIYKDIGVANPEAMLAKAKLVSGIASIIETRALTQREAADIIGMPQPK
jgi:predicted XRE-type DNA-binding protein